MVLTAPMEQQVGVVVTLCRRLQFGVASVGRTRQGTWQVPALFLLAQQLPGQVSQEPEKGCTDGWAQGETLFCMELHCPGQ